MPSLIDIVFEISADTLYSIYHTNKVGKIFGIKFERKENIKEDIFNELHFLGLLDSKGKLTSEFVSVKKLLDVYNTNTIKIQIGDVFITKQADSNQVYVLYKTDTNKYKLFTCEDSYALDLITKRYSKFLNIKYEKLSSYPNDMDLVDIASKEDFNPNDVLAIFSYNELSITKYIFFIYNEKLVMIDSNSVYSFVDRVFLFTAIIGVIGIQVDKDNLIEEGEKICRSIMD